MLGVIISQVNIEQHHLLGELATLNGSTRHFQFQSANAMYARFSATYTKTIFQGFWQVDEEIGQFSGGLQIQSKTTKLPLLYLLTHGNVSRPSTVVSLGSDYHIIMSSQFHVQLGPGVKMVAHRNSPSHTLGLSYTPVLLEGCSALDRWLIGSRCLQDIVDRAIRCDASLLGCSR